MECRINESEYRFLDILWENEPISSPELVKICLDRLGWKKSTTYTVIKNLSEKKVMVNENTICSTLVSREQVNRQEANEMLNKKYGGSIPAFLTAFLRERRITEAEARRIKSMIDEMVDDDK